MSQFTGAVKNFNPDKGWGFIDCPAAGGDVFFLRSELNGYGASKGDQLQFTLTQGDKGNKAINITILPGADGSQTFIGEVKSFNASKGFGFVHSPAAEQLWGKDCFFMKSHLRDGATVAQGQKVQFKASMSDRGPACTEVTAMGAPAAAPMMGMGMQQPMQGMGMGFQQPMMGMGMQQPMMGMGMQQPMMGMQQPSVGGAKAPRDDETFFGTVKTVNTEKGWGHISCESLTKQYGKDMFVLKTDVEASGMQPGQSVCFQVKQGPKGPHAVNIRSFSSSSQMFTGNVRSYNDGKGWGFITGDEVKSVFGGDVFFHKNDCSGAVPSQGETVTFSVDTSTGKASAKGVTSTGGGGGYGAVKPSAAPGVPRGPY
eukprot:TRINITY_DN1794_c0_g1_i1.p1 TRINITY_DN1794_c0_g1~~TRINITY_DN1794_c0_g1_i1.p1  ORF type:complete len:395 (-),score=94.04 TRINITY_DN1794_c0_g1_i1:264-1373(-)